MNVYNEAHNLAQAIKECEEFKTYDALKKKIDESPELAKAVSDFQMMQMQTQSCRSYMESCCAIP